MKSEPLYKQDGTLQTVIGVLIKESDTAMEAIVKKTRISNREKNQQILDKAEKKESQTHLKKIKLFNNGG